MRVVCQQPNYFPWLGYFEQIAQADTFIYLDNVQWIRQGRQHRTRLPNFPAQKDQKNWLTVPVLGHGHRELSFRDMQIDTAQPWIRQHWNSITALYGKAPFFRSQLEPLLSPFFEKAREHKFLIDLCEASVGLFWKPLGLSAPVWHASDLEIQGVKSERLVELCKSVEATEYYSALGASRYIDLSIFRASNIQVRWQHFKAFAGEDPRRSCDYSILDWVALASWDEIHQKLGSKRGSFGALFERSVDGVMGEVSGTMH